MRKYLYIFKSELISSLQYVANILAKFVIYFILIFVFINLWKYIYNDPKELINGYTMNQMIWYVMITEVLWSTLEGRKLCRKISNDVRSGNIAYNINKPYNYIGYILFSHLGEIIINFLAYIIFSFILGILLVGEFPNISMFGLIAVIISAMLATVISTLLITFLGLFAFIIEDSNPIYWIYSKCILILGTILPIEFFPTIIQSILKYSPIYVVAYGPAKLFVDFEITKMISIYIAQIIYIFLSYKLCILLYNKGVKKLNVNGG